MSEFIPVLELQALAPESSQMVEVKGCEVLLCHSGGDVFAVANRCTHQQQLLDGGRIDAAIFHAPCTGFVLICALENLWVS